MVRLRRARQDDPRCADLPGNWVRRAERNAGLRAGLTTDERERLKDLERENRELRRANGILRKASAYFAQAEPDRRPKRWRRLSTTTGINTGSSRSVRCYRSPRLPITRGNASNENPTVARFVLDVTRSSVSRFSGFMTLTIGCMGQTRCGASRTFSFRQ